MPEIAPISAAGGFPELGRPVLSPSTPESSADLQVHRLELHLKNLELTQLRRQLAELAEEHRNTFDFAPIGLLILDRNGLIKEANLSASLLLEKPRGHLLEEKLSTFLPPTERDRWHVHFQSALQSQLKQNLEIRLNANSGYPRFVRMETWCIQIDPYHAVCRTAIYDITEHKTAEETLEKRVAARTEILRKALESVNQKIREKEIIQKELELSSRLIEDLYNLAPCGYHSLDQKGRYELINDTELKWLGYDRKEIRRGYSFEKLLTPGSQKLFKKYFRQLRNEGSLVNAGLEMVRKNRTIFPVLWNATLLMDENNRFVTTRNTLVDITSQKENEQSMARLGSLVKSSQDAIFSESLDGKILSWNKSAKNIFGYSEGEVIGKSSLFFVPKPLVGELAQITKRLKKGDSVQHFETVWLHKNQSPVEISLTVSAIRDPDGRILGFSFIAREISERKRLEQSVLSIADHVQERIARDLHDGLGPFLGGIGCLSQVLQVELSRQGSSLYPQARKITKLVEEAVVESQKLARGLHITSNKNLVTRLNDFALQIADHHGISCSVQCRAKNFRLQSTVANQLFYLTLEAAQNAVKHGKASKIGIKLTQKGLMLRLRVKDNGKGFNMLTQKNPGLGLRSMEYRAKIIHGQFKVTSKLNRGTEVECIAPINIH